MVHCGWGRIKQSGSFSPVPRCFGGFSDRPGVKKTEFRSLEKPDLASIHQSKRAPISVIQSAFNSHSAHTGCKQDVSVPSFILERACLASSSMLSFTVRLHASAKARDPRVVRVDLVGRPILAGLSRCDGEGMNMDLMNEK